MEFTLLCHTQILSLVHNTIIFTIIIFQIPFKNINSYLRARFVAQLVDLATLKLWFYFPGDTKVIMYPCIPSTYCVYLDKSFC